MRETLSVAKPLVANGSVSDAVWSVTPQSARELASVIDGGLPQSLAITISVSSYPDIEVLAKREPK